MATKIRNVELLTLARSDSGVPVLGHVGVGIDANLIQDFEMGLSRVSSAAQFNLALNVEGATTNTAHYGGIAFTQGASADTVMASIKAVNTSVDGYVDLSFNTRSVSDALLIEADGSVSTNGRLDVNHDTVKLYNSANTNNTYFFAENTGAGNAGLKLKNSQGEFTIIANDRLRFISDDSPTVEVMSLHPDGSVGIGTGSSGPVGKLEVNTGSDLAWFTRTAGNAGTSAAAFAIGADSTKVVTRAYGDGIVFELAATGSTASEKVRFTNDGKVGIGTGSSGPSRLLELSADTNSTVDLFRLTNADATYSQTVDFSLDTSKDLVITGGSGNGGIHFNMGSRGYTFSNGNVGIGMTPGSTYGLYVSGKPVKFISDGSAANGAVLELVHANSNSNDVVSSLSFANNVGGVARIEGGTSGGNTNGYISFFTDNSGTSAERLRIDYDGQTYFYGQLNIPGGSGSTTNRLNLNYNSSNGVAEIAPDSSGGHTELKFSTCLSGTKSERMRIHHDGKVGINTGSTTLTELLEVNGNAKATKFIGPLEGNADTATAATALETTRAISVGPDQATSQHDRAGDIAKLSQDFDGSVAIQFDSKLESHLYNSVDNKTSTINKTTGINIAAESSNDDVIIIGSDINTPQLKINKQGLVVGFKEVATTGSGGSGGISAITVNTNGLLYLNEDLNLQTTNTSDSTPTINFYLKAADLFTELKISDTVDQVGDLEIEVGGTTKYLTLPDASFTEDGLALIGDPANTLQVTIGGSAQTLDLGGLSVTSAGSATDATNANNIATAADNANLTRYLTFVASSSGTQSLLTNTGITYNPSTNTLTATNFSGALSGNATTSSGLLVGTTTYTPSNSATGGVSLVSRNSSNEVSIAKLILSNSTTTTENIDVIVGKVSDSDLLYDFAADKVRNFIDPNDSLFLPAPSSVDGVNIYPLTVSNATSAGSATNAGSAVSISAGEGNQAFSGVTSDGFVKLSTADDDTKGVLAVGALESGDIPDNAADTSGNAATATKAGTLTLGEDAVAANLAATANTVVVRGVNGVVNVGNLFCANIGSSDNAAGDITAESLTVTNATNSIVAKEIMPRGTATVVGTFDSLLGYDNWIGNNEFAATYVVTDTRLGDYTDSNKGAFNEASFLFGFSQYSSVVSDKRIKENIESFGLGLDFVRLLEPKKYNYIGSSSPRVHHGAVAQEIEEALDALGVENHSFINIPSYHEKSEEEKEKATKSYNTQDVMWVLFNAVKQLDAKVQELEKQLDKSE